MVELKQHKRSPLETGKTFSSVFFIKKDLFRDFFVLFAQLIDRSGVYRENLKVAQAIIHTIPHVLYILCVACAMLCSVCKLSYLKFRRLMRKGQLKKSTYLNLCAV